jgi:hypothetical protein
MKTYSTINEIANASYEPENMQPSIERDNFPRLFNKMIILGV